jgi:hypothetical protein
MTTGDPSGTPDLDRYIGAEVYEQARTQVLSITTDLAKAFDDEHQAAADTRWQQWEAQIVEPLKPVAMDGLDFKASLQYKGVLIPVGVDLSFVLHKEDDERVTDGKAHLSAAEKLKPSIGPYADNPNAGAVVAAKHLGVTVHEDYHEPVQSYGGRKGLGYHIQTIHKPRLLEVAGKQLVKDWTDSRVVGVGFTVLPGQQKKSEILAEGIVLDPAVSRTKIRGHNELITGLNPYSLLDQHISGLSPEDGKFGSLKLTPNEVIELAHTPEGVAKLKQEIQTAAETKAKKVQKAIYLTQRVLEAITVSEDYQAKIEEAKATA